MEWVASTLTPSSNVVYPALLKLMRTPRLPVVDWTDAPTDLNGLVRFGERRNLVLASVPSRTIQTCLYLAGFASVIPNTLEGRQYCDSQISTLTYDTDLIPHWVNKGNSLLSPISVPCALCICLQFPQLFPEANVKKKRGNVYTGCPGRNVPDFGRMFLKLKYTDITQNTYIQSWTVTEKMAREIWKYGSCYTLTDYQIHIKTARNMWFL